jgi:hypothetical protein
MEPIQFSISLNGGTASIGSVNGDTEDLVQTYGLILTQYTSGDDTLIFLRFFYFENDLAGKDLRIIVIFTLPNNNVFTFPTVTASYI